MKQSRILKLMAPAFVLLFVLTTSCTCPRTPKTNLDNNRYLEFATLWTQTSAEAKSLYLQGYNLARLRLDEALKTSKASELAIISDLDETVVDNSPYQAKLIQTGDQYPKYWDEWINLSDARALPGAKEFFDYAKAQGVAVFFVSNRTVKQTEQTKTNLTKIGIPFDDDKLLFKTDTSSKIARRQKVAENYKVILFLGDNAEDFPEEFEGKNMKVRDEIVAAKASTWGSYNIVFPNPLYGSWEGALYQDQWTLPEHQKAKLRASHLRGF